MQDLANLFPGQREDNDLVDPIAKLRRKLRSAAFIIIALDHPLDAAEGLLAEPSGDSYFLKFSERFDVMMTIASDR